MRFETPFPHSVIDGFLPADKVAEINREWPSDNWMKEAGRHTNKWSATTLPPSAREVVESIDLAMVEAETGISRLIRDKEMFGAGLHCIPRGGFLKMHVDFNRHPKGWHRRVNLLIYLNLRWQDDWGGHLQLGKGADRKLIAPVGGRCVIFDTNDQSWHGHPEPLNCPDDVQRRSLAMYFYTKSPPAEPAHTTIYDRAA